MLDLSIIVLSYNTKDITNECLMRLRLSVDRCQRKLGNEIEVIVLDNASKDGSWEMIEQKHKWVKLIKSKVNTGYSGGNNTGLKRAKFPIILLLNSDVFVEEDTLVRVLEYFKNPNCDVLGPKLLFDDGSFQPSAGNLPNPLNTIFWILGISLIPGIGEFTTPFHPSYKSFFESPTVVPVGWITGAFFMFKREVYKKVGGFDERIFMYMDEVEFCKRIKNAGFQIWYIPSIKVTHLHGTSSKFNPHLAFVNELKGLRYYLKKYYSGSYWLVRMFLIVGLILRVMAFSILGKTKRARAYVEGLGVI